MSEDEAFPQRPIAAPCSTWNMDARRIGGGRGGQIKQPEALEQERGGRLMPAAPLLETEVEVLFSEHLGADDGHWLHGGLGLLLSDLGVGGILDQLQTLEHLTVDHVVPVELILG